MVEAINTSPMVVTEICWTINKESNIEPFLNEFFPERLATPQLAGHYSVRGGTLYITGKKVYFKEQS